jgi:rubrerythrin
MTSNDDAPRAKGTTPDYYNQLGNSHGHPLVAIEGRLHPLIWKCRVCGQSALVKEAPEFKDVDCE